MFSSGPNYNKLKTNLRLCINRLKLLEKKKTELALKSRKEIADYISSGKTERAKIRVEHIIREDYLVEAMEILEMFCDLILTRFGLVQQMKAIDEGMTEAISSIIWITPRLQADIPELKIVSEQLTAKYGKPYAIACLGNDIDTVSDKLMHKMSVKAPPKITVEKYMIEIAKYYNVEYHPDPQVIRVDGATAAEELIELGPAPPLPDKNDLDGGDLSSGGFQYPPHQHQQHHQQPPYYPPMAPFNYPHPGDMGYPPPPSGSGSLYPSQKMNFEDIPPPYFPPDLSSSTATVPTPGSSDFFPGSVSKSAPIHSNNEPTPIPSSNQSTDMPELPGVPDDTPARDDVGSSSSDSGDIDFDELTRRFEALKKRK